MSELWKIMMALLIGMGLGAFAIGFPMLVNETKTKDNEFICRNAYIEYMHRSDSLVGSYTGDIVVTCNREYSGKYN